MSVGKIGFVGLRTPDLAGLRHVLEHGLGLQPAQAGADTVGYDLADGTRVEAFGPRDTFHDFFTTGPVVGFTVDDFEACRLRLAALGIEFVSDIQSRDGWTWVHFRLPDGTVAEIIGRDET